MSRGLYFPIAHFTFQLCFGSGIFDLQTGSKPFVHHSPKVLTREEALELFEGNPFKVDLISRKVPYVPVCPSMSPAFSP